MNIFSNKHKRWSLAGLILSLTGLVTCLTIYPAEYELTRNIGWTLGLVGMGIYYQGKRRWNSDDAAKIKS